MPDIYKDLEILPFATPAKLRAWLTKNHRRDEGLWIKFAKKASGIKSVTYEQARELAIAFGWIDGLKNTYDADYYVLRFTPRRKRSKWSQINRGIAEDLIKAGKMKPSGLKQVEAAKADGRWQNAYPSQKNLTEPVDFKKALAKNAKAKKFYPTISRANRSAILFALHDATREETRARRIAKFVAMLAKREVPHPGKYRPFTRKHDRDRASVRACRRRRSDGSSCWGPRWPP